MPSLFDLQPIKHPPKVEAPVVELAVALGIIDACASIFLLTEGGRAWAATHGGGLFLGSGFVLALVGGVYLIYHRTHFCRPKGENQNFKPLLFYSLLLSAICCFPYVISQADIPFSFSDSWQGILGGSVGTIAALVLATLHHKASKGVSNTI